ncbi:hypothetical protein O3P69_020867 [Scylla paramamosain]|uniref:Uncharacterized protein n=1 Tax=Scylla paramamosain TaxID=85552 RepID=A0AAW0TNA4_SCYPA
MQDKAGTDEYNPAQLASRAVAAPPSPPGPPARSPLTAEAGQRHRWLRTFTSPGNTVLRHLAKKVCPSVSTGWVGGRGGESVGEHTKVVAPGHADVSRRKKGSAAALKVTEVRGGAGRNLGRRCADVGKGTVNAVPSRPAPRRPTRGQQLPPSFPPSRGRLTADIPTTLSFVRLSLAAGAAVKLRGIRLGMIRERAGSGSSSWTGHIYRGTRPGESGLPIIGSVVFTLTSPEVSSKTA